MYRTLARSLVVVGMVVSLASCSGVKSSTEYKELAAEVSELEAEINDLEIKVEEKQSASNRLVGLKEEREKFRNRFSSMMEDPAQRSRVVKSFGVQSCTRYAQALVAAMGLADNDFGANLIYWRKVDDLTRPEDIVLGDVSPRDDDTPGMKLYQDALRATGCAEKADAAYFKKCEKFDKLVMKKNPAAFKGKCVTGTVRIAQFDSNTGPCSFQGYLGGGYDVRAQFGETLTPATHHTVTKCNWTQKLVEGNSFTFWGFGLGAFSYETTNGGTQTVPAFKMVMYLR